MPWFGKVIRLLQWEGNSWELPIQTTVTLGPFAVIIACKLGETLFMEVMGLRAHRTRFVFAKENRALPFMLLTLNSDLNVVCS